MHILLFFSGFLLKGLQRLACQLLNCLFAANTQGINYSFIKILLPLFVTALGLKLTTLHMIGGVHSRGCVWQRHTCMAWGYAWQGACIAGSMHGRGACMAQVAHVAGGMHVWWGVCMARGPCVAGGHAWHRGCAWQGACVAGDMHAWQGACMAWWGCAWQVRHAWHGACMGRGHAWRWVCMVGGMHGMHTPFPTRYYEIRSMSGWYASLFNYKIELIENRIFHRPLF